MGGSAWFWVSDESWLGTLCPWIRNPCPLLVLTTSWGSTSKLLPKTPKSVPPSWPCPDLRYCLSGHVCPVSLSLWIYPEARGFSLPHLSQWLAGIFNITSHFEMFGDETVTKQDVLLEKTYPISFHILVRKHQANNCKNKRRSVWRSNVHQIERLNPRQSVWYNKTKIRHSTDTEKMRAFIPTLV